MSMEKKMQVKHVPEAEVLQAVRDFRNKKVTTTPEQTLAHKYPPKLVLARMERMVRKGLLDYGVSLRTAWEVVQNKRNEKDSR